MLQSYSDVNSLDSQTLALFTSAFISNWILHNSSESTLPLPIQKKKKETVQKKIMTQASCHHSYVLASAGLLAVALKARWHLLMPLRTTGMICGLFFGQVNGGRMQAMHLAGGRRS